MTNRQVVSQVRSTHKLLGDSRLTNRSILAEVKSNSLVLINQKANERKLWSSNIFTPLECVEMEEIPLGECCGISSNKLVSRSRLKLPSIASGNFQYLIQGVYDVGLGQALKYTPLNRFISIQSLGLNSRDVYYWIHNSRLIISSPHVKTAKIIAVWEGEISDELLYPKCDCMHEKKDDCHNKLDDEFKCPGFLITAAIKMSSDTLLNTYFRLPSDNTSDGKEVI
jgi:hypothetical protein